MPMLQAILLSAGDFARGALHAKIFPEPIRMQLLDFYSRAVASLANTHHVGDTLRLSLCIFQKRLRISYFLQPLEPAGLFLLSEARKIW